MHFLTFKSEKYQNMNETSEKPQQKTILSQILTKKR